MGSVWSERVAWSDAPDGWWIDGMPLDRVAYGLHTISGLGTPALRGSNIETAAEPGVRWRPKVHQPRTVTLALYLLPDDEQARRDLQRILGQHAQLVSVERTVDVDGRVERVQADCEIGGAVELAPTLGREYATASVELFMPDPYWYLPERTWTIQPGETIRVWNPGTVRHHGNRVELVGPLTDPTLTNDSVDVDPTAASPTSVQLSYSGSVADGEVITLDSRDMTATNSAGTSVASNVSKTGKWWMELGPERNELALTVSSGTGEARVIWRPALL